MADVSIINRSVKLDSNAVNRRLTSNPNVLVELGFAAARLGWDRILLVQNTHYGTPEDLPFDLRGRRVITYDLRPETADRGGMKKLLQGRFEVALRAALDDSAQVSAYAGIDVPLWWGIWINETRGFSRRGRLFIREVGSAGFIFDLEVANGAHIGTISGFARLVSGDRAYARFTVPSSSEVCEISFQRSMENRRRIIEIDEAGSCSYYRGMGASFNGVFERQSDALFEGGVLDELGLQRLYSISGSFFEALSERFQLLMEEENIDTFHARVTVGGVRGLFTIVEGILMHGDAGELWVAFIDDSVVRYFTTECKYKNELPKTIENWRQRFSEKKVVSHPQVDIIPKMFV